MKKAPTLYVVPSKQVTHAAPSVSKINRAEVREGDIVAFVAYLSFDARDAGLPFDSMRLATALRDQLSAISGQLPDENFLAIANICGELLNAGAQAALADHLAMIAVTKARHAKK